MCGHWVDHIGRKRDKFYLIADSDNSRELIVIDKIFAFEESDKTLSRIPLLGKNGLKRLVV
jgi:hypothetical protein